jgi:uncharacterized repeat protein (TIGR03803 family)
MLYGTTDEGGANSDGTVFSITTGGTLTTLHSFDGPDGQGPLGKLVRATNGTFYGTTALGGTYGYGTIFSITTGGTFTTLHSFDSSDGATPYAGLIQATDGKLYGTTKEGGNTACFAPYGCGTVFKITSGGTLTTLHSFDGTDGYFSKATLVQAANGILYGTAPGGGANGSGVVFSITTEGAFTVLHNFDGTDGAQPAAGLVQATNGALYGTTSTGGTSPCTDGCGTVFSITTGGTVTTLHSFDYLDGANPSTGLVQATNGTFYGAVDGGGTDGDGVVFSITTGGTFTVLHNFDSTDGDNPGAGLLQATNGTLYGTTYYGGANEYGTVYSFAAGLGPFVSLEPTSGKEGAMVGILGQGFSNASVVKFDGIRATAVTRQGTRFLKATVPSGAMTGLVTVTTGGTTLASSQKFRVTPTITGFSPPNGPVGTPVTITGTGLMQTTKVTFNNKVATFTVNSDTQVTATVPAGATTGKIAITTPGGTAKSATSFTVD